MGDAGGDPTVRRALGHLVAGAVASGEVDPSRVRDRAATTLCRAAVAVSAADAGRIDGDAPLDPDGLPERLFGDGTGIDPDAIAAPHRRRATEAIEDAVRRGSSAPGGSLDAGFGAVRRAVLASTVEMSPASTDGGVHVAGEGPDVLVTDDGDREGVHYTPRPVVERTVGAALDPQIARIRDAHAPDAAADRIADLRVLDPAAGTGRFLVGAVEHLAGAVVERRREAGADVDPDGVRQRIARSQVYGVDSDPLALELARAALWIHTGAVPRSFRVGNALTGPGPDGDPPDPPDAAGDRPLDWSAAFPDVRGFDAVVGNPPYVRGRDLPEPRRELLRARYGTAGGAFDLYVPFVERSAALGDRVALVVPNKWTTAEYGRRLRDRLLDRWGLESVVDLSALDVFEANVYPVILVCAPGAGDRSPAPVVRAPGGAGGERSASIPRSLLDRLGDRVIPLNLDRDLADVFARVLRECGRWGEYADTSEGIHTGNVRGKLVVDEPLDDSRPLADGRSIRRYRVTPSGRWIRYDPSLVEDGEYADLRSRALFEGEKLLIRDISDRPVAAFDDRGLYALNTLYSARPTGVLSAKYLLAVFNSAFVARYFRSVYGGTHVRDGYLRFKPTFVEEIPVPDPDPDRLSERTRTRLRDRGASPDAVVDSDALMDALGALTDRIRDARAEHASLDLDIEGYFGEYDSGPSLGSLPGARPAPGVGDTPLTDTTGDREGLRIGHVELRAEGGTPTLLATARYKPDGVPARADAGSPDRWGFVETDPIPALEFEGVDPDWRTLLTAFVPHAVERAGADADFRATAAKTITPLNRLRALTLPAMDDVADGLGDYRETVRRSETLQRRIAATDGLIDRVVCDLYGLSEAERGLILD